MPVCANVFALITVVFGPNSISVSWVQFSKVLSPVMFPSSITFWMLEFSNTKSPRLASPSIVIVVSLSVVLEKARQPI